MSGPRFKHDCKGCQYLGADATHDFYFCAECDGGTVIARYADDGGSYTSMAVDVLRDAMKNSPGVFGGSNPSPLVKALQMFESQ